jgi:hypothetical protein
MCGGTSLTHRGTGRAGHVDRTASSQQLSTVRHRLDAARHTGCHSTRRACHTQRAVDSRSPLPRANLELGRAAGGVCLGRVGAAVAVARRVQLARRRVQLARRRVRVVARAGGRCCARSAVAAAPARRVRVARRAPAVAAGVARAVAGSVCRSARAAAARRRVPARRRARAAGRAAGRAPARREQRRLVDRDGCRLGVDARCPVQLQPDCRRASARRGVSVAGCVEQLQL